MMHVSAWTSAIVALSIAWSAGAGERIPPFAYFLDNFTDANLAVEIPPGTVVIGWSTQTQRTALVAAGRVVGCSTGLSSNNGSRALWNDPGSQSDLHSLFNTASPPDLSTPALRKAFAAQVLAAAEVDPSGFPSSTDPSTPTGNGGFVLWAQDIEGPLILPRETAAAILAIFWAGREVLGPNMQIIPVPAKIIQLTSASAWDLQSTVDGSATDNYVKFLNLGGTLSAANRNALTGNHSIDLLSLLHLCTAEGHPLIDGILAQQYSASGCSVPSDCPVQCQSINCDALPGQFSSDIPEFYDTMLPYAILSAHDCPNQLFLKPPAGGCTGIADPARPWKSFYRGSLPFSAGVYWNQPIIDPQSTFDPALFLTPTSVLIGGGGSSCTADLNHDRRVDAGDLAMLLAYWGPLSAPAPADFDNDMVVGSQDISSLLAQWGACPLATATPWISVLIADGAPPAPNADMVNYVNRIKALAPYLEQIHLRFAAGATNYSDYVTLIGLLRSAYGSTLAIGFHPDNSNTSCCWWLCGTEISPPLPCPAACPPDPYHCWSVDSTAWRCVLSKSIEAMNAINALVDPTHTGNGFTIFSLEQSYVENVSTSGTTPCPTNSLAAIKSVLSGDSTPMPDVTAASPPVKFGNVLPSYGGPEIYGATGYDFGYPQTYNLYKPLIADFSSLVTDSPPYFPAFSAQDCLPSTDAFPCWVVDVDSNAALAIPKIPCFGPGNAPNVYTYVEPGSSGPSPALAAAYVSFLLTQLPPISNPVTLGGSEVFLTFSGESTFLGAPGWTLDNINTFHSTLMNNFMILQQQQPGLFPAGGADPSTLKFAIWSFDQILEAIPVD